MVISKWAGADGVDYAALCLVYQTTEQLRQRSMLTLDTPPMVYPIKLRGLSENLDGLYTLSDLQKRFKEAIAAYYELPEDSEELKEAA